LDRKGDKEYAESERGSKGVEKSHIDEAQRARQEKERERQNNNQKRTNFFHNFMLITRNATRQGKQANAHPQHSCFNLVVLCHFLVLTHYCLFDSIDQLTLSLPPPHHQPVHGGTVHPHSHSFTCRRKSHTLEKDRHQKSNFFLFCRRC
jgi:hypothetical protein